MPRRIQTSSVAKRVKVEILPKLFSNLIVDPIALYNLDRKDVASFIEMGFQQDRVIEEMRSLQIRRVDSPETRERILQKLL